LDLRWRFDCFLARGEAQEAREKADREAREEAERKAKAEAEAETRRQLDAR
jgi:hypothetical protein